MEVPDPLSDRNPVHRLVPAPVPDVGKPFREPRFGTTLTRVTKTEGILGRHEYSRHDPFNRDQSLIVLPPEGAWRVYRTDRMPYNQPGNLVCTLGDMAEPRWDGGDPDLIWAFQGFRIVTVRPSTGTVSLIKDFARDPALAPVFQSQADLYRITTKDEGEPSLDKRHWALLLQGSRDDYRARYIFTWDRQEDRILGLHEISPKDADIDWVGMSPLGNWVLIGGGPENRGRLAGLTLADRELSRFHRLDHATGHADVGLDSDGREVIVMQNVQTDHIDMIPLALTTRPILDGGRGYAGTNRIPLIRLFYSSDAPHGFSGGVHISCNAPGLCVVSTHAEPGARERNWLDRTITLVTLEPRRPRVFYLAKVHNTTQAYWEETQASITRDGRKVVWASNWGREVGKEQLFLMQLDLPPLPAPHR